MVSLDTAVGEDKWWWLRQTSSRNVVPIARVNEARVYHHERERHLRRASKVCISCYPPNHKSGLIL
jgi:hypothetical protein